MGGTHFPSLKSTGYSIHSSFYLALSFILLMPQMDVVLICDKGTEKVPINQSWLQWHQAGKGPKVTVDTSYDGDRNNFWTKSVHLMQTMLKRLPQKHFYAKVDSDTMLIPENLFAMLSMLYSNAIDPKSTDSETLPLYLGTVDSMCGNTTVNPLFKQWYLYSHYASHTCVRFH
jgi:hypothetical protein